MNRKWTAIVAVSLTLTGSGTVGEITSGSWNVTEEATPVAPGDLSGSVGSVGLTVAQGTDSEFVIDNLSTFAHDRLGSVTGKVATAQSQGATEETDTTIGLSLTTTLSRLNADRTASPVWFTDFSPPDFVPDVTATTIPNNTVNYASTVYRTRYIATNPTTGDVYVTSYGAYDYNLLYLDRLIVVRYDAAGNFLGSWGSPGTGNGQFGGGGAVTTTSGGPSGIAVNPLNGNVYVFDAYNFRVQYFTASGTYLGKFGSSGTGNGQFSPTAENSGNALAVSPVDGSVYVVDEKNNRWQKFTSTGTYVGQVAFPVGYDSVGYTLEEDIAVDSTGNVYVSFSQQGFPGTSQPNYSSIWVYNSSLVFQRMIPFTLYGNEFLPNAAGYTTIDIGQNDSLWVTAAGLNYAARIDPVTGSRLETIYSRITSGMGANDFYAIAYNAYNKGVYLLSRVVSTPPLPTAFQPDQKRVQAFISGTPILLSTVIQRYIDLIDPTLTISYTASANPKIVAPGWNGNVWDKLKELCAVYAIQLDCISGVVTVSDLGTRTLRLDDVKAGTTTISLDSRSTGRSIEIVNYNTSGGSGVLYNAATDNRILTVAVGQDTVETIQTQNYPVTLNPVGHTNVTYLPFILPGQYSIVGSDNQPVSAEQWAAYGASVTVSIGTAPGTIDVHLVGPSTPIPGVSAPYSLGVSDGTTTSPAFSVTGNGVFVQPETMILLTGADASKTPTEVGQSIDNIFMSDTGKVYDRGIWASVIATGPVLTLNATVPTTAVAGFGLGEGSLVSFKESTYRVTSAAIDNAWTRISATRHVTVGARDSFATGRTVGQHDTLWSGYQVEDEFIKPYRS